MSSTGRIIDAMIGYYAKDARRVCHFLKVYALAKAIGELEGMGVSEQEILEIAAITHDIGIKNSEIKYGSSAGPYQEIEGPPEARRLLGELGIPPSVVDRVCWLIARHHTYSDEREIDHQILIEADFIVNAVEDGLPPAAIESAKRKIFRTRAGTRYLESLCPGP